MAVRAVEWKKPYTWGKAIEIDENKVISLRLRDENNLIIYDEWDNEIYVDLQLPDWIRPLDAFPVGITTGRVLIADDWDKTWTIICAKTTSWDNIKILYADDWTLWIDNWTWLFKQIYLKWDVDTLIQSLRTYIDYQLSLKQDKLIAWDNISIAADGKTISATTPPMSRFLSLWDCSTWQPISFPASTPFEYITWDHFLVETVDTTTNYRPSWTEYTGIASTTVETEDVQVWDLYIYDGTAWLLQLNHDKEVSFANIAWQPTDNTNLATALNAKQNTLATQTAYTSQWTSTKVPTITTNTLWQVTAISETNISFPVTSVNGSTWAVTWLQTTSNLKTNLTDNSDTYYPSQKAVKTAVDAKQDTLVNQTNIKSINWNSLLGSGDLTIAAWVTSVNTQTWVVVLDADDISDSTTTNKWTNATEKSTWNWKQDALSTQTAYTSQWGATKVPQITTNTLGQVTWITEVNITFPTQQQADWNEADNTKVDYIKNKPTIPTDTSDLTNNAWFITGITSSDVTTALWYTPYSSSNPSWYTSNTWDVVWPASSNDWHLALFDWITGKLIRDGWAVPKGVPSWWNNWDVLTNVSWTPTWSAPSGWDVEISSQSWNILTSWAKIWAWTESNYQNLGSYDSNTIYITV